MVFSPVVGSEFVVAFVAWAFLAPSLVVLVYPEFVHGVEQVLTHFVELCSDCRLAVGIGSGSCHSSRGTSF